MTKSKPPKPGSSGTQASAFPRSQSSNAKSTDWLLALSGGAMFWASFPPLGFWPLAWVAIIPWLVLIRKPTLGFQRPYLALYSVGVCTWLVLIQAVRLPHWALYFGWVALSLYLAVYTPLFIGLSRVAVHQCRVPLWLAAPIVWTGLEAARSWLFTGFAVALLGHTQVSWPTVIQISDFAGPHAVSCLIVFVSALLTDFLFRANTTAPVHSYPTRSFPARCLQPIIAIIVLLLVLVYGSQRHVWSFSKVSHPSAKIALIQGSVDITFDPNDDPEETFTQYMELSRRAVAQDTHESLDLIVWPESMFTGNLPHFTTADSFAKPDFANVPDLANMSDAEFQSRVKDGQAAFYGKTKWAAGELGTPLLVGTGTVHWGTTHEQHYNTALWIDANGEIVGRYDKMHPVMFGEYIPFGDQFPILYRLSPMPKVTSGETPLLVTAGDLLLMPCICFENTVPHLIRHQINELESSGKSVDGLVTITNDGWFWGSNLLDLHLACGVFRAVENRRSLVIAANTGLSAHIDQFGHVLQQGRRRESEILMVRPTRIPMTSFYTMVGDWLGTASSLFCLAIAFLGWRAKQV